MAYKHGVYTSEVPTSIVPAVNSTAGLPVIFFLQRRFIWQVTELRSINPFYVIHMQKR